MAVIEAHADNGSCGNRYKQKVDKDSKHRKQQRKPVKEDSFPSELVFAKTDFAFVDNIVESGGKERSGPKGYRPSFYIHGIIVDVSTKYGEDAGSGTFSKCP